MCLFPHIYTKIIKHESILAKEKKHMPISFYKSFKMRKMTEKILTQGPLF